MKYAGVAITAPFPGAAVNRSRRCTRTRVPFGSLCSRSPGAIFRWGDAPWRTLDQDLRPWAVEGKTHDEMDRRRAAS